jgi:hypothetical protein
MMHRGAGGGLQRRADKRFTAADEANQRAGGGTAGFEAASEAFRCPLPKLSYKGFSDFSPEAVNDMHAAIWEHPELSTPEKKRASNAIRDAIDPEKLHVPQRAQIRLLKKVFPEETVKSIVDAPQDPHWLGDLLLEIGNLPRSLEASFDLSAVMRQGLVAGARHPLMAARNIKPMLEAAVSKGRYEEYMNALVADPVVQDGIDHRLAITDVGSLGQREEMIASKLINKIPGRGSARATRFLNKVRAEMKRALVKDALVDIGKTKRLGRLSGYEGSRTIKEDDALNSLAEYINTATGRGELRKLAPAANVLNSVLFSPRLLKSRFNLLMNPRWYARQTPYVRKQAMRAMFQTVSAGALVLGLAKAAGAEVGIDPRSSDFGKVKIGDTRFDIWGGFQPLARYATQLAVATYISPTTGKPMPIGSGKFGTTTRGDVALRFMRSKLAPNYSLLADWAFGKDVTGSKFRVRDQWKRVTPLLVQDALDLYHDRGGGPLGIAEAAACTESVLSLWVPRKMCRLTSLRRQAAAIT